MLFAFPAAGLLLLPLEVVWPSAASSLLHEDSAIEWVTALASAAAAVAAAYVARLLWSDGRRRHAAMYALVAIGAILATGEEMSWGQRVVGFGTPESLREANEQEELNVHNLGDVYPAYLGALLIVGLYGSVGSWFVYRVKQWHSPTWYLYMPPTFLSLAFFQLAAYRLVRYTGLTGHNYGEWCEYCAVAAIAIFVALNARRLRSAAAGGSAGRA